MNDTFLIAVADEVGEEPQKLRQRVAGLQFDYDSLLPECVRSNWAALPESARLAAYLLFRQSEDHQRSLEDRWS
jgi:hypothetical protein